MKTIAGLLTLLLLFTGVLRGQESQPPPDTTGALPRLDIPEITIIGKKAIILPFARKGEVYDATLYEAPPPDTSLLGSRRMMPLPIGALPRYEEQLDPWRMSVSGGLGNYTSGNAYGYLDYTALTWGVGGAAGFATTQGHTTNAKGRSGQFELNGHSIVRTDNQVLTDFRADGTLSYEYEKYGMYGISFPVMERTKKTFGINGMLGSTNREGAVLDLSLGANVIDLTDAGSAGDSSVSVVTPAINATFSTDLNATRVVAGLRYKNSSLNYRRTTQSPGFLELSGGAKWRIAGTFILTLRGIFQHASGSDGNDRTLVAPDATLAWEADKDRVWSFWYRPELVLDGYDELFRANPYLLREILIKPSSSPVRFGSTLKYNSEGLSVELDGSYAHSNDYGVQLADSGRIRLGYVDADVLTVGAHGTITFSDPLVLHFHGQVQPARVKGTSSQLPMMPIATAGARLEYDAPIRFTFWGSGTYTSKRNVDLDGSRTLKDAVLFDAGASTHLIPRTSLSFHIENIFNTAFQWWEGYSAPGRQFMVEANISLR